MKEEIQIYFDHLRNVCPDFTELELNQFGKGLTISVFNKHEFYLMQGKIQNQGGYIIKGLVRAFHTDDFGNEKNIYFKTENEYSFHYSSFMDRKPCPLSFQCLEPSVLVSFPIDHIQNAYMEIPRFEKYGRIISEQRLKTQQVRLESLLFQNAEERYINFTNQYPHLFNRITISQLSSYLGVERQTLTRIRQKISKPF